ncbi:Plasmodium exported protein (Pm-fam-a like), unknown function [Plasmodium ovale wallikeri]|uniref:Fam-l protein n=2 Tax=Plasmodium ovale TaxID=36330 RepID=A0A1C3KFF5_PLAOA|nr:Plasmodium exported protein (Pm-fam-a like), unknown function [Plasmodium ovale wallikeri]SBT72335.1 Protein of unknown function, putative [Plasmodium ovale]
MCLMKEKIKFSTFTKIFLFVLLIWICHYYNEYSFSERRNRNLRIGTTSKLLTIRLLAKRNSENVTDIVGLNEGKADNAKGLNLKSHEKGTNGMEKNKKPVNEKLKSSISHNKGFKLLKKRKCNIYNPFRSTESYYDKRICEGFGFVVENNDNKNILKWSLKDMSLSKIYSVFFIPTLCLLAGGFIAVGTGLEWFFFVLPGICIFILIYVIIKSLKYAHLSSKNRKNNHNK